ncbi:MAG: class I fructose-bisphosphate aldolase [Pseudonocardiaceae bacterium]
MKLYRLNRLFNPRSSRCLNVAVDHGFAGQAEFLAGIEDMAVAVDRLVDAAPDAIQLTVGQAHLLQARPGRDKPALVLRSDTANVYGRQQPDSAFAVLIDEPVEQAVRLDAACVVVNMFDIPDAEDLRRASIENVSRLKGACERAGMPLMVEPLVMKPADGGGYTIDGDLGKITALVRQAVELGADIIKADPTDDLADYHRVVEIAGVPVLARGGGRVSDEEILARTHELIGQGAAGIVYGRNIIQHPSPGAITRALMAIVHDDWNPEKAMTLVEGAS